MVVPKEIREMVDAKPGQILYVRYLNKTDFVVSTKSPVDQMYETFGGTNIWGEDPMEYLNEIRQDRVLV
jgi:hypothetical protein